MPFPGQGRSAGPQGPARGSCYVTPSPTGASDGAGHLPGQTDGGLVAALAQRSPSPARPSHTLVPAAEGVTEPHPAPGLGPQPGSSAPWPPAPQWALSAHSVEGFRPSLCWEWGGGGRGVGVGCGRCLAIWEPGPARLCPTGSTHTDTALTSRNAGGALRSRVGWGVLAAPPSLPLRLHM